MVLVHWRHRTRVPSPPVFQPGNRMSEYRSEILTPFSSTTEKFYILPSLAHSVCTFLSIRVGGPTTPSSRPSRDKQPKKQKENIKWGRDEVIHHLFSSRNRFCFAPLHMKARSIFFPGDAFLQKIRFGVTEDGPCLDLEGVHETRLFVKITLSLNFKTPSTKSLIYLISRREKRKGAAQPHREMKKELWSSICQGLASP